MFWLNNEYRMAINAGSAVMLIVSQSVCILLVVFDNICILVHYYLLVELKIVSTFRFEM